MDPASQMGLRLVVALTVLIVMLALASLMVGPAGLSPRATLDALISGDGPAGMIVRDIRCPARCLRP